MELRPPEPALGGKHSGPSAQCTVAFGHRARHDTWVVGEENHRKVKAAGNFKKTGALIRCFTIDTSRPDTRVVGHDGHRPATEPRQPGEETLAIARLEFEDAGFIGNSRHYFAHLVGLAVIGGH